MLTINEAMVLQKAVSSRLGELKSLRDKVAIEKTTTYPYGIGDKEKKEDIVVKYDIKLVDKKITELELFLFKIESKIKQSNAVTKIEIEVDVDKLLSPLE